MLVIDEKNAVTNTPDFKIVLPGGCNAKCGFCFNNGIKTLAQISINGWILGLKAIIKKLPSRYKTLNITGGEPSLSPALDSLANLIHDEFPDRFERVVLNSNGTQFMLGNITKVVDHINISRHCVSDNENYKIFLCDSVPNKKQLKTQCSLYNKFGIDVTLNVVYDDTLFGNDISCYDSILDFIKFAKKVGASGIAFRNDFKNGVKTSLLEKAIRSDYKPIYESSCLVCRTDKYLVKGMLVTFKYGELEPSKIYESNNIDTAYEIVYQPNGKLTIDYEGKTEVEWELNKPSTKLKKEKSKSKKERDDYVFTGCGGWVSRGGC